MRLHITVFNLTREWQDRSRCLGQISPHHHVLLPVPRTKLQELVIALLAFVFTLQ